MTDMYESFKTNKHQLKKQLLEENPNQELDAMRELKVMDDIMKQVSELTSNTVQQHDQIMNELKYQHAVKNSQSLQDKKNSFILLNKGVLTLFYHYYCV